MYNIKKNILCTISVILIFIAFLFFPLFRLLAKINIDDLQELVKLKLFHEAVVNSIVSSLISTVISISLAVLSALCIERSKIKFNNIFSFVFIIPMLIPSISHSFGLAAIFGSNGIFTKIFGINIGIYGLKGIILGSIMYSFPVAFIMFKNILQYEDGSQYNVCKIFGINKWHQFFDITLPYLKRTFILAFFSVFTMVLTDYGVPLLIGAKTITLPVLMYNKTVAMIDYNTGSSISLFLLIPAIIAFFVDSILRDNKNAKYNTEKVVNDKNFVFDCISYMVCIFISICAVLPIIVFLIMVFETTYPINPHFTLNHIIKTIDRGALKYLYNSIIIAFFTGLFGTIFSFVCSYLTARIDNKSNKIIHICSILSMAFPGIIIGFSYIIAFKNSFFYGSMSILFIVNIFHFISSPYLMMYNSLNKININLELVGKTLGVSRFYIIKDVIIPKVIPTIIEMFSYFFVNAMMTISAVSFLCPPAPKPVSLMINQFEAQLLMESAAFVSLLILLINLIIKILFSFFSFRYEKKIKNGIYKNIKVKKVFKKIKKIFFNFYKENFITSIIVEFSFIFCLIYYIINSVMFNHGMKSYVTFIVNICISIIAAFIFYIPMYKEDKEIEYQKEKFFIIRLNILFSIFVNAQNIITTKNSNDIKEVNGIKFNFNLIDLSTIYELVWMNDANTNDTKIQYFFDIDKKLYKIFKEICNDNDLGKLNFLKEKSKAYILFYESFNYRNVIKIEKQLEDGFIDCYNDFNEGWITKIHKFEKMSDSDLNNENAILRYKLIEKFVDLRDYILLTSHVVQDVIDYISLNYKEEKIDVGITNYLKYISE